MRKVVLVLLFGLVAGCGQRVDQLLDRLAGHETQALVLAKTVTMVGNEGLLLKSVEPMKVTGDVAAVCLVLKSGIALAPQPTMDKYFQDALGGALLSATLKLKTGQSFNLTSAGQSWRRYGVVTSAEEISACISCGCGPKPAVGSEISEIVVKANPPLKVLGIYWESTNAFDRRSKNN